MTFLSSHLIFFFQYLLEQAKVLRPHAHTPLSQVEIVILEVDLYVILEPSDRRLKQRVDGHSAVQGHVISRFNSLILDTHFRPRHT